MTYPNIFTPHKEQITRRACSDALLDLFEHPPGCMMIRVAAQGEWVANTLPLV